MKNTASLRVENVTARYGTKVVLRRVCLYVEERDYLAIIGPNGGGKTTLVKILLGQMAPAEGRVTYYRGGQEVEGLSFGYLPQYSQIDRHFPISVRQVVHSGLVTATLPTWRSSDEKMLVEQTLQRMELDTLAERPISDLSGGQLQRVLLARAMVRQPEVLVLDEPNTYIDRKFQEQMYQMLEDINRDCTLIVVTHDIAPLLSTAKHVACVNGTLHCHPTAGLPLRELEKHLTEMG